MTSRSQLHDTFYVKSGTAAWVELLFLKINFFVNVRRLQSVICLTWSSFERNKPTASEIMMKQKKIDRETEIKTKDSCFSQHGKSVEQWSEGWEVVDESKCFVNFEKFVKTRSSLGSLIRMPSLCYPEVHWFKYIFNWNFVQAGVCNKGKISRKSSVMTYVEPAPLMNHNKSDTLSVERKNSQKSFHQDKRLKIRLPS